jgi:hypothetical protein
MKSWRNLERETTGGKCGISSQDSMSHDEAAAGRQPVWFNCIKTFTYFGLKKSSSEAAQQVRKYFTVMKGNCPPVLPTPVTLSNYIYYYSKNENYCQFWKEGRSRPESRQRQAAKQNQRILCPDRWSERRLSSQQAYDSADYSTSLSSLHSRLSIAR